MTTKRRNKPSRRQTKEGVILRAPDEENKVKEDFSDMEVVPEEENSEEYGYVWKRTSCCMGFCFAVLTFWLIVILVLALLPKSCKTYMGRVCNDRGVCEEDYCVCEWGFSGEVCQYTQIPGYIETSNTVCHGHGTVLPLEYSELAEECRLGGWNSPSCYNRINGIRHRSKWEPSTVTVEDVQTLPQCVCEGGYDGVGCEKNIELVLSNIEGLVCSGRGMFSVDFVYNDTGRYSQGIQCIEEHTVNLLSGIESVSYNVANRMREHYINQYSYGTCGSKPLKVAEGYVILWTEETQNYRCICEEGTTGNICQFGRCPSGPNGAICSGNGNPLYGQGVLKNTSNPTSNQCQPRCSAEAYTCDDGTCRPDASLCGFEYPCPSNRPFRCSSGVCVARPTNTEMYCADGTEFAWYDDIAKLGDFCTTLENCGGLSYVDGTSKMVLGGWIEFSSPLVYVSAVLDISSSFELFGEDGILMTSAHATDELSSLFHDSFQYTFEDKDAFDYVYYGNVQVLAEGNNLYRVYPLNYYVNEQEPVPSDFQTIQLRNLLTTSKVTLRAITSRVVLYEDSWYGVIRDSVDQLILSSSTGRKISDEECFRDVFLCMWNANTSISLGGRMKACFSGNNTVVVLKEIQCSTLSPVVERYTTSLIARSSVDVFAIEGSNNIKLYTLATEDTRKFRYYVEGGPVKLLKYVTAQDFSVPCTCLPTGVNQSTYNERWINEASRLPPSISGEFAVGEWLNHGQLFAMRGIVVMTEEDEALLQVTGFTSPIEVQNVRLINAQEYRQGKHECDTIVTPSRFANGKCSKIYSVLEEETWTCDCTMRGEVNPVASCTCTNSDKVQVDQCTCDLFQCSCVSNAYGLENLLDEVDFALNDRCVVTRVGTESGEVRGVSLGEETSYVFTSSSQTFPGFPREFVTDVRPVSNMTSVDIFAKSSLFSDTWTLLNTSLISVEERDNRSISRWIPVTDLATVYDTWKVVVNNGSFYSTPVAYFTPSGVPIPMLTSSYIVRSKDAFGGNSTYHVTTNADTTWDSGAVNHDTWIEYEFEEKHWVHAVYVNLRNAGIYRGENNPPLLNSIRVEYVSTESGLWRTLQQFSSDVINGTDARLIMGSSAVFTSRIRLYSYFRIEMSIFLPLTDQTCSKGRITNYERNVVQEALDILSKTDTNIPCTSSDTCLIGGASVTNDGICQDQRFVYGPLRAIQVQTAFVDMKEVFNVSTPIYYFPQSNISLYAWSIENNTDNCFFDNITEPSGEFYLFQEGCFVYWHDEDGATTFQVSDSSLVLFEQIWQPERLALSTSTIEYCPPGTDVTDCGPSNRLVDVLPGVHCLDMDIANDIIFRGGTVVTELHTIQNFLSKGATYTFNIQYTSRVPRIRRDYDDIRDCSGSVRCPAGDCGIHGQCEPYLYDCPGDGCTRASPNSDKYQCACKKGYGGISCAVHVSNTFAEPKLYDTDPAVYPFAGRPPPLRIKPPGGYLKAKYTTEDVNRMMFIEPATSNVQKEPMIIGLAAPFGNIFVRYLPEMRAYTTCPYMRATPWGSPVTREECVREWNVDGSVKSWRTFKRLRVTDGQEEEDIVYSWDSPTEYDEFPFRCAGTGHCVRSEDDCHLFKTIEPNCNGNGEALADGTCRCYPGFRTFILTDAMTASKSVPYTVTEDGGTNPTVWEIEPNTNWKSWSPYWCKARDCQKTDCSPPLGCFPGTKEQKFLDAQLRCPDTTNNPGMCASDVRECNTGPVESPLPCSGKGILRRRTYTDEEWYCECGDKISNEALEITELISNGWGGRACDAYFCPAPSFEQFWLDEYDKAREYFYLDDFGDPLPGLWKSNGGCGAPVGPDPDDLSVWNTCCPGEHRLERCSTVPCRVNGEVRCTRATECRGKMRIPLVYTCNRHGRARMDGTCECDKGYTYDLDRFSYKGCFRQVYCPVSRLTKRECSRKDPCTGDFDSWLLPQEEFFSQQIWTAIARMGLPLTNHTFVRYIAGSIGQTEQVQLQAYVNVANRVLSAILNLGSCVCLFEGEDPSNPRGMRPYDTETDLFQYGAGSNFPYYVKHNDSLLGDGYLWNGPYRGESQYRALLYNRSVESNIVLSFNQSIKVFSVRIHGWEGEILPGTMAISVRNDADTTELCGSPRLLIDDNTDYQNWLDLDCGDVYTGVPFTISGFRVYCGGTQEDPQCISFKQEDCLNQGGTIREPDNIYPGCNIECCRQVSSSVFTSSIIIRYISPAENSPEDQFFYLDEVVVFGHAALAPEAPQGMLEELSVLQGAEGIECRDFKFLSGKLGFQGEPFLLREPRTGRAISVSGIDDALQQCQYYGGVVSTITNPVNSLHLAQSLGQACYEGTNVGTEEGCLVNARETTSFEQVDMTKLIQKSCLTHGCFSRATSTYDIYSTPDIRYANPEDWGTKYKTHLHNNQDSWNMAMRKMMTEHRRYQQIMLIRGLSDILVLDTRNPYFLIGGIAVYPLKPMYLEQYTKTLFAGSWVFRKRTTHYADAINTESPVYYLMNPVESGDTLLTDTEANVYRFQQPRLAENWKYKFLTSGNGITGVPVLQDVTLTGNPLNDQSMRIVPGPAPTAPFGGGGSHLSSPLYTTNIPDGVIELETWTNPQACRITLSSGNMCGADPENYNNEFDISYILHPGNDYFFMYRDILEGNPYLRNCTFSLERNCEGYNGGFKTVQQVIDYNYYSINIEGPCAIIARRISGGVVQDVYEGTGATPYDWGLSGNPPGSGSRPQMPGATFESTRAHAGCHRISNDRVKYEQMIVYPRFRSAKIRTRIRARSSPEGNNENFNMGWFTHPYMLANVDVKVLATLGKYGYEDYENAGFYPPFSTVYVRPSSVSFTRWRSVDFGMMEAFEKWKLGGSESNIPRYFDSTATTYNFWTTEDSNGRIVVHSPFIADTRVIDCQLCPIPLDTSRWLWDQRYVNFLVSDFVDQLDDNSVPHPSLHVLFSEGVMLNMRDFRTRDVARFTRSMAYWQNSEYKVEWFFDQCLGVHKDPNSLTRYVFLPRVCEEREHLVLCARDVNKYMIKSGFQCDACGNSDRAGSSPQPNATCTTQYALSDPNAYPLAHEIKNAYVSGTLRELIQTTEYDYDAAAEFILDGSTNYGQVFTDIRDFLSSGISTQPDFTTPGQVPDPYSWLNMDIELLYPTSCGRIRNPQTGIKRYLCSRDASQCSYAFMNSSVEMDIDSYPTILNPVPATADHKYEARCGISLFPEDYTLLDEFGAGILAYDDFSVVDNTDTLKIQARYGNGTFVNTGKNSHGYLFLPNKTHYITGQVLGCDDDCEFVLFLSPLDVFYAEPANKTYLSVTRTVLGRFETSIEFTDSDVLFQVVGWEFTGLVRGQVIELRRLILSNAQTISACQEDKLRKNWKLPTPVIESGQISINECIYNDEQLREFPNSNIGECYCRGRAFGGASCESLALDTPEGVQVCAGVGERSSHVIGMDGALTITDNDGAYFYGFNEPACKCIDYGSVIRTYLNPEQGNTYPYLLLVNRPRNTDNFIVVTLPTVQEVNGAIESPLMEEEVSAACASQSAALPSWVTVTEATEFLSSWAGTHPSTLLDLAIDGSELYWGSRSVTIEEDIFDNSTRITSDAQLDAQDIYALNFNNLAFVHATSTNPQAIDGRLVTYSQDLSRSTTLTITFNDALYNDIEVNIYSDTFQGSSVGFRVELNSVLCIYQSTQDGYERHLCDVEPWVSKVLTIEAADVPGFYDFKEVLVLNQTLSGTVISGRSIYF